MELFLVLATYSPNYFAKQMFPLQYECGNYIGHGAAKKIKIPLQKWRKEDRGEMEDKKRYYLDVRNPSSRQPPPRSVA